MKAQLEAQLSKIDCEITELNIERKLICLKLAELGALFNPGDRVAQKDGGDKGVKWEICRIEADFHGKPLYAGSRIKKDGTLSKLVNQIWQINFFEFVKVG